MHYKRILFVLRNIYISMYVELKGVYLYLSICSLKLQFSQFHLDAIGYLFF